MAGTKIYDIVVVGGGINGCGIARDAAGRGYSVCLIEMHDLANGTSSGSTKLIHGGLRYLEYYEFRLVREALFEREVLWASAPHIIWPARFVLPYLKNLRPPWLLRIGLFIYDHLGGRKLLPPTKDLDLRTSEYGRVLKPGFRKGFEYSDCGVDDSRLVILTARDAADHGATIRTRTKVTGLAREGDTWAITLKDNGGGKTETVRARVVVNAAGPWIDNVLSTIKGSGAANNVREVKGSHVVVPRLFDHDRCYIFQNADGRVIFMIPFEQDYTLIGTTDEDYEGDPGAVFVSPGEIEYLCAAASEYLAKPVTTSDVVWSFSAVRPLYDDGASKAQEATRDYVLRVDNNGGAPVVNVFGGKLTTFRRLAEAALTKIGNLIGSKGKPWTRAAKLPGGDFPVTGFEAALGDFSRDYPFLETAHARRLFRLYGTRARVLLGEAGTYDDLGVHLGEDLYGAEVRYLAGQEWARTADDILWRRTKRGLKGDAIDRPALEKLLAEIHTS